jgi:hypothetical protein
MFIGLRIKGRYSDPILMKLRISRRIFEKNQILNLMKIRPVGDELFHDERKRNGQTLKADSHIACRAHAFPLPCHEAKGLECVFPI